MVRNVAHGIPSSILPGWLDSPITVLRSGGNYERPTATFRQTRQRRHRRFAPRAAGRHDAQSVLGLPRTQHAAVVGGGGLSRRRLRRPTDRSGSTAGTSPSTTRWSRRDVEEFLVQLGVFGIIAGALLVLNVFAALADGNDEAQVARRPDSGSHRYLDAAPPRIPARQRRADRRQSRPAHARGCASPDRAFGRSRHRPAAGRDPARHLCQRALDAVGRLRLPCRRPGDSDSRLYGVGWHPLRRLRFAAELLGRPQPDRA